MKITAALVFAQAAFFGLPSLPRPYNVTYRVVQQISNNCAIGVIVDNALYPLTTAGSISTLYHTGEAPKANIEYKYAIINRNDNAIIEEEDFSRTPVMEKSTLNEYYNRTWNTMTVDKLPVIMEPLPILNRVQSDLHIEGQIPTIHITGNQTAIDIIHNNSREDIEVPNIKIVYINPKHVKTFDNITLSIAGHSTRSQKKLSYKFKIPKKQDLFDYRRFKLKSMATDPSYMRDQLSSDIAKSIGIPTTQYSYVRVFINDKAIGLFGLAEMFKNPWVRNVFANGNKKYKQGALYVADVSAGREGEPGEPGGPGGPGGPRRRGEKLAQSNDRSGADFVFRVGLGLGPRPDLSYMGDNVTLYSVKYPAKENPSKGKANHTRIMDLTKFISEQPTTGGSNATIPLWNEKVDIDSFLRGLAMEVVTSNADGYLTMGNNYMLYDDLEHERILFSGQDFDLSLGSTIFNDTLMNGGNYTEFPGLLTRPLAPALLAVPAFKEKFEKLLLNFAKLLVNPEILNPRVDQLYKMLAQDVAWDKSLMRVNNGGRSRAASKQNKQTAEATSTKAFTGADDISFDLGVNGPTNMPNRFGLKDWIALRSANLITFLQNQKLE
ncbi:coth protein-domain-containing protein [Parasitella parasitica]|nr:coth protein-domain-containing protein [Parasitella parasitica]